jgi:hypothetical protein
LRRPRQKFGEFLSNELREQHTRAGNNDSAVSAHAIDHLGAQAPDGLREMHRVLKPPVPADRVGPRMDHVRRRQCPLAPAGVPLMASDGQMARDVGFAIADEGTFNGNWFAVLRKPDA